MTSPPLITVCVILIYWIYSSNIVLGISCKVVVKTDGSLSSWPSWSCRCKYFWRVVLRWMKMVCYLWLVLESDKDQPVRILLRLNYTEKITFHRSWSNLQINSLHSNDLILYIPKETFTCQKELIIHLSILILSIFWCFAIFNGKLLIQSLENIGNS